MMSILVPLFVIMVFSREATGRPKYHGSTRGCDSACQQECIEVINKYRWNHNAPPLTFSRTLANKAQKWADRGRFGYDMNARGKYGQLIEWDVKDDLPNFTSVVKYWHDNAKDFNFTTGKSKTGKTLHDFTQIVWKKARKVGCARSEMFGSKYYVVWMDSDGVVSPKFGIGKENVGAPKEDDSKWFELKQNANGGNSMSGSGDEPEPGIATMRTLVAEEGSEGEVGRARKKSVAGEGTENAELNEVENEQRILNNNVKDYLMDDEHSLDDVIHNENKDTGYQEPESQGKTADDEERILNHAGRVSGLPGYDVSGGGQLSSNVTNFDKADAGGLAESINSIHQSGQYFDSTGKTSGQRKGHDVVINIAVPKKPALQPPVTVNITTDSRNSSNYTRNDNNNNNNNNNSNNNNDDVLMTQPASNSKGARPANDNTMGEPGSVEITDHSSNDAVNNNNQKPSQFPEKGTTLSDKAAELNFNQNVASSHEVNNNSNNNNSNQRPSQQPEKDKSPSTAELNFNQNGANSNAVNNNNQRANQQQGDDTTSRSDAVEMNFNQNVANSNAINNNSNNNNNNKDRPQDNKESAQPGNIGSSNQIADSNYKNNYLNSNVVNNNNNAPENMESASQPVKETGSSNHIVDPDYNHNYASNSALNNNDNNNNNRQDNRVNNEPADETAPSNHNVAFNYDQNNPKVPGLSSPKPISPTNNQEIAGDNIDNGNLMQYENKNNYTNINNVIVDRNGTHLMVNPMGAKQVLQDNASEDTASQFSRVGDLISLRLASLPNNAQPSHVFSGRSGNNAHLGRQPGHEVLSSVTSPGAQDGFATSPSKPSLIIRLNDPKVKFRHLSGEKLKLLASPSEFSRLKSLSNKTTNSFTLPGKDSSSVTSPVFDEKPPNLATLPNKIPNAPASPGNHNSLVAPHNTLAATPGQSESTSSVSPHPIEGKGVQPMKIKAVGEALMLLPNNNAARVTNRKLPNLMSGVESASGFDADGINNAEGQDNKDVDSKLSMSSRPLVNSNLAPLSQDEHGTELSEGPASTESVETSPALLEQYKNGNPQEAKIYNDSKNSSSFQENQSGTVVDYDKSKTKDAMATYLSSKLNSASSVDTGGFTLPKVAVYAENPTREEKAECKDKTAMCSVWVAHRPCKETTYAEFMRQHCKATCGYCALPSEAKMNDETAHQDVMKNGICRDAQSYAFSCPRWRSRGYCDKKPKEMGIFCRKTCGFCEEENILPLASNQLRVESNEVLQKVVETSPQAQPETISPESQTNEAAPHASVNNQGGELTLAATHPAALEETNSSNSGDFTKDKLDEHIVKEVGDLQRKLKAEIHVSAVAKSTHYKAVAGQSKNNIPDVAKEPVETKHTHAKIQDPKPVATDGCDVNCQKECLQAHNVYRANHGAPPLQLDPTLAQQAQSWANKKVFKHSPWASGAGGESIALGNLYPTYTAAVKAWHDEEKDFDWSKGSSVNGRNVDHFTQVVWKKATLLGCGRTTVNGEPYYIAQMDIPGVIAESEPGYGKDNVEKPRKPDMTWFMDSSPYWKDLQTKDSILKNIDHYIL